MCIIACSSRRDGSFCPTLGIHVLQKYEETLECSKPRKNSMGLTPGKVSFSSSKNMHDRRTMSGSKLLVPTELQEQASESQ